MFSKAETSKAEFLALKWVENKKDEKAAEKDMATHLDVGVK